MPLRTGVHAECVVVAVDRESRFDVEVRAAPEKISDLLDPPESDEPEIRYSAFLKARANAGASPALPGPHVDRGSIAGEPAAQLRAACELCIRPPEPGDQGRRTLVFDGMGIEIHLVCPGREAELRKLHCVDSGPWRDLAALLCDVRLRVATDDKTRPALDEVDEYLADTEDYLDDSE
jgi:hypothetical protein